MRIDQLLSFIEIAKCGSINMAAKNMLISHQSLNQSIKNLEQEIGYPLLERTKQGVRLTNNGEKTLIAAQDIIQRLNVLYTDLANDQAKELLHGKLNLYISPMLNISILPFAFTDFYSRYPNIATYTCEFYRRDIINQIQKNPNSCGLLLVSKLITKFFDNLPDDIELIELKTYPIYIAVSPRHPLASHKSLSINTVSQYPIIVYEVGGASGIHALSSIAPDMNVILSTNNSTLCSDILNKDNATMYSFEPYIKHRIFPNFIHIPLNNKQATFTAYLAINKNVSSTYRKIISAFINVFTQYL